MPDPNTEFAETLVKDFCYSHPVHDAPMKGYWLCKCGYMNVGSVCTKCSGPRYESEFLLLPESDSKSKVTYIQSLSKHDPSPRGIEVSVYSTNDTSHVLRSKSFPVKDAKDVDRYLPFGKPPNGLIRQYIGKAKFFSIRVYYNNNTVRDWIPNRDLVI